MNPSHPSLRFQAHLAFPQVMPSDQICQKSFQVRPTTTHGQKDSAAKIKDRLTKDKNGQLPTMHIAGGILPVPDRNSTVFLLPSFSYDSNDVCRRLPYADRVRQEK